MKYEKGSYTGYLLGCAGSPAISLYHDGKGFKSPDFYKPDEYMEEEALEMLGFIQKEETPYEEV